MRAGPAIVLFEPLPAPPEMKSTVGRAQTLGDNIRAAARNVGAAEDLVRSMGRPSDWEGDASEAADHAATIMMGELDATVAALQHGSSACVTFADALERLAFEREGLVSEIDSLALSRADLWSRINGAPPEQYAALQLEADDYNARHTQARDRIDRWVASLAIAEFTFVLQMSTVDTLAEGRDAVDSVGSSFTGVTSFRLAIASGDPEAVAELWDSLSELERQVLTTENPELVGNLDGIPATDRDDANRAALYSDIDHLQRKKSSIGLSDSEEEVLTNALALRDQINLYRPVSADVPGEPTGEELLHVYVYKPGAYGGDGGVAVSFGDPDHADHVSIAVPGVTTEMAPSLAGNAESAFDLYQTSMAHGAGSVATIAWLDYDAPSFDLAELEDSAELWDLAGAVTDERASEASERLRFLVGGLRAADQGDRAHLTVIGHSYGSTTVAQAAAGGAGLAADDLVLVGSPGVGGGVDHASDLMSDPSRVWVASERYDRVTWIGGDSESGFALGMDPAFRDFGAQILAVDGYPDGDLIDIHTSHFEKGTKTQGEISLLVVGLEPETTAPRDHAGRQWLADDLSGSEVPLIRDLGRLLGGSPDEVNIPGLARLLDGIELRDTGASGTQP